MKQVARDDICVGKWYAFYERVDTGNFAFVIEITEAIRTQTTDGTTYTGTAHCRKGVESIKDEHSIRSFGYLDPEVVKYELLDSIQCIYELDRDEILGIAIEEI